MPYTFIGEIVPQKNRDLIMSLVNAMQILGTVLIPCKYACVLDRDIRNCRERVRYAIPKMIKSEMEKF